MFKKQKKTKKKQMGFTINDALDFPAYDETSFTGAFATLRKRVDCTGAEDLLDEKEEFVSKQYCLSGRLRIFKSTEATKPWDTKVVSRIVTSAEMAFEGATNFTLLYETAKEYYTSTTDVL